MIRAVVGLLLVMAGCRSGPSSPDVEAGSLPDRGAAEAAASFDLARDRMPQPIDCSSLALKAGVQCSDQLTSSGKTYAITLAPGEYLAVATKTELAATLALRFAAPPAPVMATASGPAPQLALFNPAAQAITASLEVKGEPGRLSLRLEAAAFAASVPCAAGCNATLQLPAPLPASAYRLVSPAAYQFGRRELVQALVASAAQVAVAFPGAGPVGLADLSEAGGDIPGTDQGQPRHPPPSHQQGFSADISYYRKSGDNLGTTPACPTTDYQFCSGPHDLDLPRNVAFMLALGGEPRVSQIIVDPMMKVDLLGEADRQLGRGLAGAQAVQRLKLLLTSGVAMHTDHFHTAVFRQCNDGADNDGDGLVDLKDPGCADALDDSE